MRLHCCQSWMLTKNLDRGLCRREPGRQVEAGMRKFFPRKSLAEMAPSAIMVGTGNSCGYDLSHPTLDAVLFQRKDGCPCFHSSDRGFVLERSTESYHQIYWGFPFHSAPYRSTLRRRRCRRRLHQARITFKLHYDVVPLLGSRSTVSLAIPALTVEKVTLQGQQRAR